MNQVTLGEIVLPKDDEYEFNPFEWAQVSAKAHSQTLQELAGLRTKAQSEQDTIAKLTAQLEDFIKAKNETETAMLQQFMVLLNEKKRKIRDQSRLLATAKVDSSVGKSMHSDNLDLVNIWTQPSLYSRHGMRRSPAKQVHRGSRSEKLLRRLQKLMSSRRRTVIKWRSTRLRKESKTATRRQPRHLTRQMMRQTRRVSHPQSARSHPKH